MPHFHFIFLPICISQVSRQINQFKYLFSWLKPKHKCDRAVYLQNWFYRVHVYLRIGEVGFSNAVCLDLTGRYGPRETEKAAWVGSCPVSSASVPAVSTAHKQVRNKNTRILWDRKPGDLQCVLPCTSPLAPPMQKNKNLNQHAMSTHCLNMFLPIPIT